jgi:gamma-glutamyltranspeptidase/glutathione hydrolase
MVVTAEAHASQAGLEILRQGGNAVDAAVAAAFTLAVSFPRAGNLGGGGFLLLRARDAGVWALDFRETAPRLLTREMFFSADGGIIPGSSTRSGLAVGVPGTVAGLAEAHRRWGSRPWRDLLAPAIRLAERGFVISRRSAAALASAKEILASDPAAQAIFLPGGSLLGEGDRLVQKDLARTLRRIAANGSPGFYHGPVAGALVQSIRSAGGVMTEDDLSNYRPLLREPIVGTYRGHRVITFPPPSSGGIALLQMLRMLDRFDLRASGPGSSLTIHRMAEAERRAFADRSRWLADPAFFEVPVRGMLDAAYLRSKGESIHDESATPSDLIAPGEPASPESEHTTHLSVADRWGNAVALTTTLNSEFGTGRVAAGTGVLLNNEIDDFSLAPGSPNQFGLVGSGDANAPQGGKRPLSSMSPTIVESPGGGPRPLLVLGSRGGPTIITTVLEILVNVIDHGLEIREAVDAPRFHHQWKPDAIQHEPLAFPEDVAAALRARGHRLEPRAPIGDAAVIGTDSDGTWLGAADPRGEGIALGYR